MRHLYVMIMLFVISTNTIINNLLKSKVSCNNEFVIAKKTKKEKIVEKIYKYCEEYNLDPIMLLSIASLESNFNPTLKNKHSSAFGVPQFIFDTGRDMYNILYPNKEYKHYQTTIDEQINMMCLYLSLLDYKYHGDKQKILREYSGNGTKGYYSAILRIEKKYRIIS